MMLKNFDQLVRLSGMIILRALNIGGKLVLLYLLSTRFSISEMADYGVILACIGLITTFSAFDVHRVVAREIISAGAVEKVRLIRDHFAGLTAGAALAAGGMYTVALLGFFPLHLAIAAAVVAALQVLATDQYRILLALERPLAANAHLNISGTLWVLVAGPIIWAAPVSSHSLEFVLYSWAGSIILAMLFGALAVRRMAWSAATASPIEWRQIVLRMRSAVPILVASFVATACTVADRLILKQMGQDTGVAILFFYVSILQVSTTLVDVMTYQTHYPEVVRSGQQSRSAYLRSGKALVLKSVIAGSVLTPALALAGMLAALLTARTELTGHYQVIIILALAFFLDAQATTLANVLYADFRDHWVLQIHLLDLGFTMTAGIILIATLGVVGAALLWLGRGVIRCLAYSLQFRRATSGKALLRTARTESPAASCT